MEDNRFWSHVDRSGGPDSCWPYTGYRNYKGYGILCRRRKTYSAHRYAYVLMVGPIPKGLFACHHCDTPPCVNPAHLYLGTNSENIKDGLTRGRVRIPDNRGERNGQATLTAQQVQEIRRLYATGRYSQSTLGLCFSVAQGQICQIVNRKAWASV